MRLRSGLVAIALSLLILAGCRESEGELARRTVDEFTAALVRGNGADACEKLAESGVSELLLAALEADLAPIGLDAPTADRCALIAARLAQDAPDLVRLQRASTTRTLLEGDVATVETTVGAYELEEVAGRWRLTRFEPVAAVLAGRPVAGRPVLLTIARPELGEPALGATVAGRTRHDTIEVTANIEPASARVRIEPSAGTRVKRFESRGGRLLVELALRPGHNDVLLSATAPGRAPAELLVRLTRE